MAAYMVAGMWYGDSLRHGLGKGSGRGRPKGSRNGYISPGAAYMTNYEVQGERASTGKNMNGDTRGPLNRDRYGNPTPTKGVNANDARKAYRGGYNVPKNYSYSTIRRLAEDESKRTGDETVKWRTNEANKYGYPIEKSPTDRTAINALNNAASGYSDRAKQNQAMNNGEKPALDRTQYEKDTSNGKSFFDRMISGISDAWNAGISWLNSNIAQPVVDFGKRAWETISSGASRLGQGVTDAVLGKETTIGPNGQKMRVGGLTGVGGTADQIGRAVSGAADSAGRWLNQAGQDVGNWVGQNVVDPIIGKETTIGPNGQKMRVGGITGVGGNLDQMGRWANNTYNDASTWLNQAGQDVGNWVGQNVVDPIIGKETTIGPNGQKMRVGGITGVGGNLDQANRWLGDAYNTVSGAVGNVANSVGSVANSVGSSIDKAFNSAGATMAKQGAGQLTRLLSNVGVSNYNGDRYDPDTGERGSVYTLSNGEMIMVYPGDNGQPSGFRYLDFNDRNAIANGR